MVFIIAFIVAVVIARLMPQPVRVFAFVVPIAILAVFVALLVVNDMHQPHPHAKVPHAAAAHHRR